MSLVLVTNALSDKCVTDLQKTNHEILETGPENLLSVLSYVGITTISGAGSQGLLKKA